MSLLGVGCDRTIVEQATRLKLLYSFLLKIGANQRVVVIQLDCPSVRHWDCVITVAVEVRFQIQDQFWIPQGKLHRACYLNFVCKTSKHARLTSRRILVFSRGFRHNIDPLSLKPIFIESNDRTRITCVNLVCAYNFLIISQKMGTVWK